MTTNNDPLHAMKAYQDAISRAGVRCALDPRDMNPPSVLIRPPVLNYTFGRGRVGAEWTAWLYLPDAGVLEALKSGFDLLDKTRAALADVGVAVLRAAPADFQTPDGGIMPGFTLNWNTSQ